MLHPDVGRESIWKGHDGQNSQRFRNGLGRNHEELVPLDEKSGTTCSSCTESEASPKVLKDRRQAFRTNRPNMARSIDRVSANRCLVASIGALGTRRIKFISNYLGNLFITTIPFPDDPINRFRACNRGGGGGKWIANSSQKWSASKQNRMPTQETWH